MEFNNIDDLKDIVNKLNNLLENKDKILKEKEEELRLMNLSLNILNQNNKALEIVEKSSEIINKSNKNHKIVIYLLSALLLISILCNLIINIFGMVKISESINGLYKDEIRNSDMTLTDIGDSNAINLGSNSTITYNDNSKINEE